jgi:hypothetical protein
MSIGELIFTLPESILSFSESFYDILFTSITTPLGDVSLFALIFGFGLVTIIGVRIARLFLP